MSYLICWRTKWRKTCRCQNYGNWNVNQVVYGAVLALISELDFDSQYLYEMILFDFKAADLTDRM